MLPILQVGPLAIPLPSILLLLSIWIGMGQAEKVAPRFKANSNDLFNLVMLGLGAGVIGARLAYAARFPDAFSSAPLSLLTPRPVMMDLAGGLFAGALAALIYGQRKKMPFWPMLDALTPALAIFAIGMALAQLAAGDGYGASTRLPWGIELWGAVRHPTQIYAALFAALIAYLIWPRKARGNTSPDWQPGVTFLTFLALSAAARIFVEAFRGDSSLLLGSIRIAQVTGWIVLAGSLWLLGKRRVEKQPSKTVLKALSEGE
jgi:phosphatidylglycerol---prolipoprotein diacylglyceryl transferase